MFRYRSKSSLNLSDYDKTSSVLRSHRIGPVIEHNLKLYPFSFLGFLSRNSPVKFLGNKTAIIRLCLRLKSLALRVNSRPECVKLKRAFAILWPSRTARLCLTNTILCFAKRVKFTGFRNIEMKNAKLVANLWFSTWRSLIPELSVAYFAFQQCYTNHVRLWFRSVINNVDYTIRIVLNNPFAPQKTIV